MVLQWFSFVLPSFEVVLQLFAVVLQSFEVLMPLFAVVCCSFAVSLQFFAVLGSCLHLLCRCLQLFCSGFCSCLRVVLQLF